MIPRQILIEVALANKISVETLCSHRHPRTLRWPRAEAAARLRREMKLSLSQVGKHLGGRDHTTIMYLLQLHDSRAALQAAVAATCEMLQSTATSGADVPIVEASPPLAPILPAPSVPPLVPVQRPVAPPPRPPLRIERHAPPAPRVARRPGVATRLDPAKMSTEMRDRVADALARRGVDDLAALYRHCAHFYPDVLPSRADGVPLQRSFAA